MPHLYVKQKLAHKTQYYANLLSNCNNPKLSRSIYNNFLYGFAKPIIMVSNRNGSFFNSVDGKAMFTFLQVVELENATPGIESGQKIADYIAFVIGCGLNPITWLFFILTGYMPYLLYRRYNK